MADRDLHSCRCPACLAGADLPNRYLHHHMNLMANRLDEQHRRWFASLESKKLGHGGDTCVALILGLYVDTIRRGREELDSELAGRPTYFIPTPGAGRPSVQKNDPQFVESLKDLPELVMGGDPMTEDKYVRYSLQTLSE